MEKKQIDIKENYIYRLDRELLEILLKDRSSGKNIIWATDNYGKYMEKHLSMFKYNNYSDYFFGDAPNRRSIGFDLLERESNLFSMRLINVPNIIIRPFIHFLTTLFSKMLLTMLMYPVQ